MHRSSKLANPDHTAAAVNFAYLRRGNFSRSLGYAHIETASGMMAYRGGSTSDITAPKHGDRQRHGHIRRHAGAQQVR